MTNPQDLETMNATIRERRPSRPSEREISALVQPEVALHQTRVGIARRHLVRGALRVCAVAAGDAGAAVLGTVAVGQAALRLPFSGLAPRLPFGAVEYCGAVLVALLLTGCYRRATPHHTLSLLVGATLGVVVVSWSSFWTNPTVDAIPSAALLVVVTTCFLSLTRGSLAALAARLLPEHRRLVPAIAVSPSGMDASLDQSSGYRIAGRVLLDRRHDDAHVPELARMIRQVQAESVIVFGSIGGRQFARCLEISLSAGCEVLCTPPGHGVATVRPSVTWRGPYGLILVQPPTLKAPQVIAKRCVDVALSMLGLVVVAPLGALVALAIRLDSPGPVLFRQERVGLGGRRFQMFKFRTMRVGADKEKAGLAHLNATGDPRLFKIPDDPRISRVGGFLRQWSLDELPQLLNVIIGQMSLVGPRPFFEDDFADYEAHHFRRLGARPGITGLWQVYGRSTVLDFEEVVRLDTEYIDRWSLWLDLKILVNTIPAVMRRTGAY
jgi:exopolysaccharide biosynthesis polyprenyl glycosylphosphotransferase